MRDRSFWFGILFFVAIVAVFSSTYAIAENNLLKQSQNVGQEPAGAFLVSTEKKLMKYENAHTLTNEQLVDMLEAVGFSGTALRTACAIAKAESNGRPFAFNYNPITGDSSYGIFQINMMGDLGPNRRDKFELDSNAELFNPVTNAEVAFYMTKQGRDWTAWTSLNGKRYLEWFNKYPCLKTT